MSIQGCSISPLSVSSGSNITGQQMNANNENIQKMACQGVADTRDDSKKPQYVQSAPTKKKVTEGFCMHHSIFVVAGLLIVYGLVAK